MLGADYFQRAPDDETLSLPVRGLRIQGGLAGLVTTRLAVTLKAGWGTAFDSPGFDWSTWLGNPPHCEELNHLLSDFNMARVTIDTRPIRDLAGDKILEGTTYGSLVGARERKPDVPAVPTRTADFVFIRYIGHPDLQFNDPFLAEWTDYLASQVNEGASAYVFCHSPENLTAPLIARELHSRISKKAEIPELPWNEIDTGQYEQGRLF